MRGQGIEIVITSLHNPQYEKMQFFTKIVHFSLDTDMFWQFLPLPLHPILKAICITSPYSSPLMGSQRSQKTNNYEHLYHTSYQFRERSNAHPLY